MIGPYRLSILLSALACSSAAEEEPVQKLRLGLRKPAARMMKLRKGEPKTPAPTPEPTCDVCPKRSLDETMRREGLGESPGVPNLEYLGLGYNIFEGNPRGSDISEADPGFRSGVIKLEQVQTALTMDQDYMVPLGVDLRYITACKFASQATELSDESQYQSELSTESSQETEISGGGSYGMFSVSASYAFSSSAKYQQFTDTTTSKQSVEFEARAMCSEFKAALKPYYAHSLQEEFEMALDSLSVGWEGTEEQKKEYSDFIAAYGTHYVKDVTLGAKHIFSSVMKSEDVTTLKKNEVDIESTLSWSAQASFGGGGGGDPDLAALPRTETAAEKAGITTKAFTYVFEDQGVGASASNTQSDSESSSTTSLEQVKSKVTTIKELNVGGNPPEDGNWKTWATTVRDKPMPISYELAGIWTLMNNTQAQTFSDAVVDLYKFNLTRRKDATIISAMKYGVASGDAKAISSYNRNPSSNYRSTLQLTSEKGAPRGNYERTERVHPYRDDQVDSINECGEDENAAAWGEMKTRPNDPKIDRFACGMRGYAEFKQDIAPNNVLDGLDVVFCAKDAWQDEDLRETVQIVKWGGKAERLVMCPEGTFITGINGKVEAERGDGADTDEGITEIVIICQDIQFSNSQTRKVFPTSGDTTESKDWKSSRTYKDTFLTGVRVQSCDKMGLINMELEFSAPSTGKNPNASYKYDVTREGAEIAALLATPVRGSVGINEEEDKNELGFSFKSENRDVFHVLSSYPYGEFKGSKAKIVIQDFKTARVEENDLQTFSYLSGKNLPDSFDYVAGVVHPDGYPVNDVFTDDDIGYEISQISRQEYKIQFSNTTFMNDGVTFLAFPLWFPGSKDAYPSGIGSVMVATQKCHATVGCIVATGAQGKFDAIQKLGFSFIALRGNLLPDKVDGIVHGVVNVENFISEGGPTSRITGRNNWRGFKAKAVFDDQTCANGCGLGAGDFNKDTITFTGNAGGILIEFSEPFRGLPSVVVNPIIGDDRVLKEGSATDQLAMPYAVVEHISEKSAFVKAYWLDSFNKTTGGRSSNVEIEPISFHIVAVGPQRDPYLKDGSTIISD